MTAGDTDLGVSQQRAHSGCRAHSAPGKVVGLGLRKGVPCPSPERMGSGSLYPPTNPAAEFRDGRKRQLDHPLGLQKGSKDEQAEDE